ncbi:MAG TPA: GTPase HflX, partial [Polyangia bacterium]
MSTSLPENQAGPLRAAIVAVQLPDTDDETFAASVAELHRLGRTLGVDVVATVTQRRQSLHPAAVLGSGKLAELVTLAGEGLSAPIEAVLVDHDITPSQARNLEKATGVEVLDRTAVILEIFRRHARSRAAKAQVEIVRLQYLVPRLREQGRAKGQDRQRGGIGGKGAGESSLELDRRKIRDRIAELTRDLAALENEQRTQRARRRDTSRVALVGYTNAGKSTLMRALTGSEVYVADKLFATLDTTVRPLVPEARPRVLVSDTVGFIDKLPHGLVTSFKSTLDEALEAGLLVQVVDASAPTFERHLAVTTEVLAEIGAGDVPRLLVFNK